MSRALNSLSLVLAFLNTPLWGQAENPDSQAKSFVFRLTGDDAIPLRAFLQERMPQKVDYTKTKYFGDLNSLACSERSDCFLWLSGGEWREGPTGEGQPTRLAFTLPFRETVLKGQLTLDILSTGERSVGLYLQDPSLRPAVWELQPKTCSALNSPKKLPPMRLGECRIEFSNAIKKVLPYTPSLQYLQNSANIVLNFSGAAAKQLYESLPSEVDPANTETRRIQLGPNSYCWNLEPALPPELKPSAYVCQASYLQQMGDLNFIDSSQTLALQLNFSADIAQTLTVRVNGVPAGTCPIYSKAGTTLRCNIFYNWMGGVDAYPIGNTVQGVAVGWGIAAG